MKKKKLVVAITKTDGAPVFSASVLQNDICTQDGLAFNINEDTLGITVSGVRGLILDTQDKPIPISGGFVAHINSRITDEKTIYASIYREDGVNILWSAITEDLPVVIDMTLYEEVEYTLPVTWVNSN